MLARGKSYRQASDRFNELAPQFAAALSAFAREEKGLRDALQAATDEKAAGGPRARGLAAGEPGQEGGPLVTTPTTTTPRPLWAPWAELTREEQEEAVKHARRKGEKLAQLALKLGRRDPQQATPEPAHPALYCQLLLADATQAVRTRWHDAGQKVWLGDPRVCAFCAAWEETRRLGLGLPLPMTRAARERDLREAQAREQKARRRHAETGTLKPDEVATEYWQAEREAHTAALLYADRCYQDDGLP